VPETFLPDVSSLKNGSENVKPKNTNPGCKPSDRDRPILAIVIVRKDALQIAKTSKALSLSEAAYAPVQYIPRDDVDMSKLKRSSHVTYCPYKGEANYYSIPALGEAGINSVWTYEAPFEAVSEIAGRLAFYRIGCQSRPRASEA
jgi:uncharacterized protein (DUF427 family)